MLANKPLFNQKISLGNERKRYRPIHLEPSSVYELRVSYTSTNSVKVLFGFECIGKEIEWGMNRRVRKLLNAEKVLFSTDWKGHITATRTCSSGNAVITLEAMQWSNKIHHSAQNVLYYDIVLERNFMGAPMSSSLILLGSFCITLAVLFAGVPWWMTIIRKIVPALLPEGFAAKGPSRSVYS